MELPPNESTFEVDTIGDTTFKRYEGQFTVRCVLNMGQKHALELEKSRLLGSYPNPTGDLAGLAEVFATVRAKIVDAPEWWKQSVGGTTVRDENVLIYIYTQTVEAERAWRQKVQEMAAPKDETAPTPSQTQ